MLIKNVSNKIYVVYFLFINFVNLNLCCDFRLKFHFEFFCSDI
jgi:hypothetical protein